MKKIRVTKNLNQYHVRHFTKCKTFISSYVEERGHIYAKLLDHPYLVQKAENGRDTYKCVFCGDEFTSINNKAPNDGIIVDDVIKSDLVRREAEIRNIHVRKWKIGQDEYKH